MYGHAQALGDIGDGFAFLGHLLDRFDLELFGVTLTTHGTSYLGLIMRLGGVYETRGDSVCFSVFQATILDSLLYDVNESVQCFSRQDTLATITRSPKFANGVFNSFI